jgi:hypothetical protein
VGSDATRAEGTALRNISDVLFVNLSEVLRNYSVLFDGRGSYTLDAEWANQICNSPLVWYNPGSLEGLELSLPTQDTELRFAQRQFSVALHFVEWWIETAATPIDSPTLQRKWTNKLIQMASLSSVDASFMKSQVACGRSASLEFEIVKHLSECRSVTHDLDDYTKWRSADVDAATFSRDRFPLLYQNLAATSAEYRTYVFGEATVTARFRKAISRDTSPDLHTQEGWADSASLECTSAAALAAIRDLRRHSGLSMMAVDYVHAADGINILEVNPTFTWSYLPGDCRDTVDATAAYQLDRMMEV